MRIYIKAILLTSLLMATVCAQAQSRISTLSVNISFPQGVSTLNIGFRDNSSTLTRFVEAVQNLNADTTAIIHSINISTSASRKEVRHHAQPSQPPTKKNACFLTDLS